MPANLQDFFTNPIPKYINQLLMSIQGELYNEGRFFNSNELAQENELFREHSSITSGICIARNGDASYLFIEAVNNAFNLYTLHNGEQGHREDYTLIFEIKKEDTRHSFIEKLNRHFQHFFDTESKNDTNPSTTQIEFVNELPNGIKDLLIIKKEFGLNNSIGDLKKRYSNNKKLEIECHLLKSKVILKNLPTELIKCIKLS